MSHCHQSNTDRQWNWISWATEICCLHLKPSLKIRFYWCSHNNREKPSQNSPSKINWRFPLSQSPVKSCNFVSGEARTESSHTRCFFSPSNPVWWSLAGSLPAVDLWLLHMWASWCQPSAQAGSSSSTLKGPSGGECQWKMSHASDMWGSGGCKVAACAAQGSACVT